MYETLGNTGLWSHVPVEAMKRHIETAGLHGEAVDEQMEKMKRFPADDTGETDPYEFKTGVNRYRYRDSTTGEFWFQAEIRPSPADPWEVQDETYQILDHVKPLVAQYEEDGGEVRVSRITREVIYATGAEGQEL